MARSSYPSRKQIIQRKLAWTLKRVVGSRINYHKEPYEINTTYLRIYLERFEDARKDLERQLRLELGQISPLPLPGNKPTKGSK